MASKSLTVPESKSSRAVFKFDPSKFDAKKAAARAENFAKAVGGSTGGGAKFPGQKYTYSKGTWYAGVGKSKKPLPDDSEVVLNVFSGGANWVKWEDKKPTYHRPEMYLLMDDHDELPTRESLGDLEPDEWDVGSDGNPQDPWKPILVFPVRDDDSETVNHVELGTKSATIAGYGLFREIAESLPMHMGELPIVRLGSRKVEMTKKVTNKKGKEVEVPVAFDAPEFTVVGWTAMLACDDPDGQPPAAVTDDVGEVEHRERAPEPKSKAPVKSRVNKVLAKPVYDDGEVGDDDTI